MNTIKSYFRNLPIISTIYRRVREWYIQKNYIVRKNPHGFYFLGDESMQNGEFEIEETKVIGFFMQKCSLFIDIGANIGYFSCFVRSLGKPVISVEPHPQNVKIFKRNLELNNWLDTEIHEVGLSNKEGKFRLWGAGTGASFVKGWANTAESWYTEVPVTTMNKLFKSIDPKSQIFIKIDVEGGEYNLLQGASELLNYRKIIWMVEIVYSLHRETPNEKYLETFKFFIDNGYRICSSVSLEKEVSMEDIYEIMNNPELEKKYYNWVFWRPENYTINHAYNQSL